MYAANQSIHSASLRARMAQKKKTSETFQKQKVHVEHGKIVEVEHESNLLLLPLSTPMPNSCQCV